MRTTAIILAFVFMVGAIKISTAQDTDVNSDPKTSSLLSDVTQTRYTSNTSADPQNQKLQQKDTKGQIYIGSDWPAGTVVLRNGIVIDKYKLRYNFLTDKIQFIAGKDTLTFVNPDEIRTVTFSGHTFIYETYQYDTISRQGYFELIVPGKNKLMLRRLVTSMKPDSKYPDDKFLIKYQVDECYYISKPGLPANRLACNRKSVLTFLNDHDEDISEYLRITGNKVRNIEDLKNLVSYYNSLDEEY
jgi:hypothetical protein